MAEFSYDFLSNELWKKMLYKAQDALNIKFDVENNDKFTECFNLNVDGFKFICQAWVGCGDWESTILYYRCQYTDKDNINKDCKIYGDYLSSYRDSYFVYIPSKDEGNVNLVKKDGKFRPLDADDDNSVRSNKFSESKCRKGLKEFIKKGISGMDKVSDWVSKNCKFAQAFQEVPSSNAPEAVNSQPPKDNSRLYFNLVHLLTEYDQKQSTKKFYNRYALAHYLNGANEAKKKVDDGMSWFKALEEEFIFEKGKFGISAVNKFIKDNNITMI